MSILDLRPVAYDHPDATALIAEVQAEYVVRYGGPDESPVNPRTFDPPHGVFAVGYHGGRPVAMGGWRLFAAADSQLDWAAPAVEFKRMFVVASVRGLGFARTMLAFLEDTARLAGHSWVLLETGKKQPEAIALYESAGYLPVPAFGHYADAVHSMHFGKRLN